MHGRIVITGGCGFIGTNLVGLLIEKGFSCLTIVDRVLRWRFNGHRVPPRGIEFLELDIRSPEFARELTRIRPAVVVHLAGIHYIPYCNEHPSEAWSVNVKGTQAVLDAALASGVERFFLASTAAVYERSSNPHAETDRLGPEDIYGLCKLTNERQVRAAAVGSRCEFAIGRIFNAVGAYETNPHLIPEILVRLKSRRRIEIGNAESKRDYVHVKDVSTAIFKMVSQTHSQVDVCNIGTGKSWSAVEVLGTLSTILEERIECVSSEKHQRRVDRPILVADNSKIRHEYGWEPQQTFEQALRDALNYAWSVSAVRHEAGSSSKEEQPGDLLPRRLARQ